MFYPHIASVQESEHSVPESITLNVFGNLLTNKKKILARWTQIKLWSFIKSTSPSCTIVK